MEVQVVAEDVAQTCVVLTSVLAKMKNFAKTLELLTINCYNANIANVEVIMIKSNYEKNNYTLPDKPYFTRSDFSSFVKEHNSKLEDSSIGWLLYNLRKKKIIERVAYNSYRMYKGENTLQTYKPILSLDAQNTLKKLIKHFPLLSFIIWETRAYNEFSNHQITSNHIFVEVEKPFGESVFNFLREKTKFTVLFKANEKEISMYSDNITISVLHLTTEAPTNGYDTRLEKLLVDLFANKPLGNIISKGDYPGIYEEAFAKYSINHNLMLRYARRRNKDEDIKHFIKAKTNITPIGEKLK